VIAKCLPILYAFSAFSCLPQVRPAFEVATVKPAAPVTGGARASTSGDRVVYNNTTLLNVLVRAFGLTSASQVAGPSWVFDNRYDINAKAPDNTPKVQIPLMLQTLLIERFKLVLRHETRDLPAYVLITGKSRLKLGERSNQPESADVSNGQRLVKGWSMATLAQTVSLLLRTPVFDQTGIQGRYDFPYDYSMEETRQDSAPSIFTIIEGLGLKLESRKEPLDVIVIDAGDKVPSEN
jgi:uncharacterized protein (TIGR03435 family)